MLYNTAQNSSDIFLLILQIIITAKVFSTDWREGVDGSRLSETCCFTLLIIITIIIIIIIITIIEQECLNSTDPAAVLQSCYTHAHTDVRTLPLDTNPASPTGSGGIIITTIYMAP